MKRGVFFFLSPHPKAVGAVVGAIPRDRGVGGWSLNLKINVVGVVMDGLGLFF